MIPTQRVPDGMELAAKERMADTTARRKTRNTRIILACVQGAYDIAGGGWALLNMRGFEAVTGPKHDDWLVRTVAGILLVLGAVLLHDALRRRYIGSSLGIMAGGISGVLALVAITASLMGTISWPYFLDGLIHASFVIGWLLAARSPLEG
ncbi:MAG: hypothetical protein ABI599_11565 [Flavobacteriales bacterium]